MKEISSMTLVFLLAIFIFSPVRAEKIQVKTVDGVQVVKNPKKPTAPKGALIKDRIEFPKSFPAYHSFSRDDQGRIFVRTFEKGKKEREYFFDVFDAEGLYITKIPLDVDPKIWKGEKLYAIKENEDGFRILICSSIRWEK